MPIEGLARGEREDRRKERRGERAKIRPVEVKLKMIERKGRNRRRKKMENE